jgi:hypothetical protein
VSNYFRGSSLEKVQETLIKIIHQRLAKVLALEAETAINSLPTVHQDYFRW